MQLGMYTDEQGKFVERLSLVNGYLNHTSTRILAKVVAFRQISRGLLEQIDQELLKIEYEKRMIAQVVYWELLYDRNFLEEVNKIYRDATEARRNIEDCRVCLANYFITKNWAIITSN